MSLINKKYLSKLSLMCVFFISFTPLQAAKIPLSLSLTALNNQHQPYPEVRIERLNLRHVPAPPYTSEQYNGQQSLYSLTQPSISSYPPSPPQQENLLNSFINMRQQKNREDYYSPPLNSRKESSSLVSSENKYGSHTVQQSSSFSAYNVPDPCLQSFHFMGDEINLAHNVNPCLPHKAPPGGLKDSALKENILPSSPQQSCPSASTQNPSPAKYYCWKQETPKTLSAKIQESKKANLPTKEKCVEVFKKGYTSTSQEELNLLMIFYSHSHAVTLFNDWAIKLNSGKYCNEKDFKSYCRSQGVQRWNYRRKIFSEKNFFT